MPRSRLSPQQILQEAYDESAGALRITGDFAADDHDHDADYAALGHNHDSTYAAVTDPLGYGFPYTFNPLLWVNSLALNAANVAHYLRAQGGGTITKIRLRIGTSSGNISVGAASGASSPTSRLGTSGSVACPATGVSDVNLLASASCPAPNSWLALSADNTTATFGRIGAPGWSDATNNFAEGLAALQTSAHPIPATPAADGPAWYASFILVGRP